MRLKEWQMASLKEIRGRIASVRGTLKITSAMRMIASAKLHSAQNNLGGRVPYSKALNDMFTRLMAVPGISGRLSHFTEGKGSRVAVILITSNQSLCGAFNVSVIKEFEQSSYDPSLTDVFAMGKKGMVACAKAGFAVRDLCTMVEHASYERAALLADELTASFLEGGYSRVELIYSHFASGSNQPVMHEEFLPVSLEKHQEIATAAPLNEEIDYIVEPKAEEMVEDLLRKVLRMKLFTVMLDAAAAEHAARTLAMQIATENAEGLLGELSLQYNKLRQQAITNEILDLVGGQINGN